MTTARQAVVIALGTVLGGYAVFALWCMVLTFRHPLDGLTGAGAMAAPVALPCLLIAWALAAWSLHLTEGVVLSGRVLSLALWQAAVPVVWALGSTVWMAPGVSELDVALGYVFGATIVGLVVWMMSGAPVLVVVLARRLLSTAPTTGSKPLRPPHARGRDELEEDAEIAGRLLR